MKGHTSLTQDSFEQLLAWLDPDRELAGARYEKLRVRLIKIFSYRGCYDAEDLADETINRVTAKVAEISKTYIGDPALYFYGVAQKVHLEYLRKPVTVQESSLNTPLPDTAQNTISDIDDIEEEYACLESCMENLSSDNRRLVIEYYQEEKRAKIDHRRKLADQLGIGVNALRIRAHRIRLQLQECVLNCVAQSPAH